MLRSLKDKLKIQSLLAPVVISASGTSASADLQNYGSCALLVHVGDPAAAFDASNKIDLILADSDDGTTFTAVDATGMFGGETPASGIFKTLDLTGDEEAIYALHYRGNKRYVHAAYTETGTVSVEMSVVAVLGHGKELPPA